MSDNKSLSTLNPNKYEKDTIPYRIEFLRQLLEGKQLKPLIDFNCTDTESFINKVNEDDTKSGESYDTRIILKKRVYNFANIINQIGGKVEYIKSGTTGHAFKGHADDPNGGFDYCVKVSAYPKKEHYGNIHDVRRPENAEIMMLKLLSYFIVKKMTPHLILPYGTFNTDINTFVNLIENGNVNKNEKKYLEFIERYNHGEYYDQVSILISEWANRGDLLEFIRRWYKKFTAGHWKVIFFQLLSTLAIIQEKYPAFRHNDLKANNILVHKIDMAKKKYMTYEFNHAGYIVPNIGYHIKIWDFDFACIPGVVDNIKVSTKWTEMINVTPEQNRYYDIHYFFNTLISEGFFPQFLKEDYIPQEAKEFVKRVVPEKYRTKDTKYVHKKGRILINDEYLTADEILKTDPYFEEFRNNFRNHHSKRDKHRVKKPVQTPDIRLMLKDKQEKEIENNDPNIIQLLHGKRTKKT